MISNISLIIPIKETEDVLNSYLEKFQYWDLLPDELIIINTSSYSINLKENFSNFLKNKNINIKILNKKNHYPGAARNAGISESSNKFIAFLDINTNPPNNWLKDSKKMIDVSNADGVFGKTRYIGSNKKEKLIIASTYGFDPIETLPGSLLKKKVFHVNGLFIEDVRAGEDTDWINRLKLRNINIISNNSILDYSGIIGTSYIKVLKKWYRNYLSASKLPYSIKNENIYFYTLSALLILLSYNWNAIYAQWDEDYFLYLPHVTKVSIIFIIIFYIFTRGVFFPYRKKVSLKYIFPINFIKISLISLSIDLIKVFSFVSYKLTRIKKYHNSK